MSTAPFATFAPLNSSAVGAVVKSSERNIVVEAILALVAACVLLIISFAQLAFRSRQRYLGLNAMKTRTRFDPRYYAMKGEDDARSVIVERSIVLTKRSGELVKKPPQYGRVIPTIIKDKDWKREARDMLREVREAGIPGLGKHCSMRTVVMHVMGSERGEDSELFLRIFDSVLLGVHTGDGTMGDVEAEEAYFMKSFYQKNVLPRLPS